jgi:hypothetical protein
MERHRHNPKETPWNLTQTRRGDGKMSLKHFLKKTSLIITVIGLSSCATPDIFESLRETGYIMNPNFSGAYEPGTLIQTTRVDREGKVRPFKTPVVITLGADCFPGKVPQQKDLVLPTSPGQRTVSLDFGANALTSMASLLNINAGLVKNYSLSFEKPQVIYYPISDIFGQLSPKCVNALRAMQQAGNKLEWFEIIYEIVVANSLTFTLEWSAGATMEARLAQTNDVQQQVEGWVEAQPQYQVPATAPDNQYPPQQQYVPGPQDQSQYQVPATSPDNQYPPQQQYSPGPQDQSQYQVPATSPDNQYSPQPQRKRKPDVHVRISAITSKTTELHADGTVVVAYRSAALKPIKP